MKVKGRKSKVYGFRISNGAYKSKVVMDYLELMKEAKINITDRIVGLLYEGVLIRHTKNHKRQSLLILLEDIITDDIRWRRLERGLGERAGARDCTGQVEVEEESCQTPDGDGDGKRERRFNRLYE